MDIKKFVYQHLISEGKKQEARSRVRHTREVLEKQWVSTGRDLEKMPPVWSEIEQYED